MGKRPKKKIILILVEGRSDKKALERAIYELYEKIDKDIEVFFLTMRQGLDETGGDITSYFRPQKGLVCPKYIEEDIYRLFMIKFFDEQKIMPKDISEVIQIVDLDGSYIPDECILLDKNLSKTQYTDTSIKCTDIERFKYRNQRKRENIDYLISKNTIKINKASKPYSMYYFSSNLDHFLYGDANLDKHDKIRKADEFIRKFNKDDGSFDIDSFIRTFSEDPDAFKGMNYDYENDYKESWDYIKKGTNSLARHTNFNIFLNKLYSLCTEQK